VNINPNDPLLKRGLLLNKKQSPPAPIPYQAFVSCGIFVYKDGKIVVATLDPQPIYPEETFPLLQLLLSASRPKPAPLDWDTVPEYIQKHFKIRVDGGNETPPNSP